MDERTHFKPSSIVSYASIIKHHLNPEFGKVPITAITSSDIRRFQSKLQKDGSPSRTNTVLQLLRSILKQSTMDGELEKDPSLSVRRVQEPKVKIDPLSEEELQLALSKIDAHCKPLFTTLAYTGARPNELCALRWGDIEFRNEKISISKGRVRGKEGLLKTESSERLITMLEPVREALTEQKNGKVAALGDYVFTNKKGLPINKGCASTFEVEKAAFNFVSSACVAESIQRA